MMYYQLKTIGKVMCQITDKEKVSDLLKTANKSQLEYFISERELPVSIREEAKILLAQRTNNIGQLNEAKQCFFQVPQQKNSASNPDHHTDKQENFTHHDTVKP